MKKVACAIVLILSMLLTSIPVCAGYLNPVPDGFYMIELGNQEDRVLEVENFSTEDGAAIQVGEKADTVNQRFELEYIGDGYYKISNWHSGKVLDKAMNTDLANDDDAIQFGWTGNDNQLWALEEAGNGYYYLRCKHGKYLDNNNAITTVGNKVHTFDFTGHAAQKWRFIQTVSPTLVSNISLNEIWLNKSVNETFKLTASIWPEDATDKRVKWTSSDDSIASVDNDGNVTINGMGNVIITASTCDKSGKSASCEIQCYASGLCGDHLTWTLDDEGTLVIAGTGDMYDYSYYNDPEKSPWYKYREIIKNIIIGTGVTRIGDAAFLDCFKLTDVGFSNSVTDIGDYAFSNCSSLTEISLPESIKSIGNCSFNFCINLTYINIPCRVTKIGISTFSECRNLTSVEIPDNVTEIDRQAFYGCGLESVNLPRLLTSIGESAFMSCNRLTRIIFNGDAPNIHERAFRNVTATAFYPSNNTTWTENVMQNYGGTITWYVPKTDVSDCSITLSSVYYSFDGTEKRPSVTVKYGDATLISDTDYSVRYENNTNAGIATVTVTGIGKYTGSEEATFIIKKAEPTLSFANASVTKMITDTAFVNELTKTTDGAITFSVDDPSVAMVDRSSGLVTITGEGSTTITVKSAEGVNYLEGESSYILVVFPPEKTAIADCRISLSETNYIYDGTEKKPAVVVFNKADKLVENTDYSVSYKNNINAGTATITILGIGRYSGSTETMFSIEKAIPELSFKDGTLTKQTTDSSFTNPLTAVTDGELVYDSLNTSVASVNRQTGKVTINGVGTTTIYVSASSGRNYTFGKNSYELTVTRTKISSVNLKYSSMTYTGKARTQTDTTVVKAVVNGKEKALTKGTDYSISYNNNTKVGTATMTVKGKGKYTGTIKKTFKIKPVKISSVKLKKSSMEYAKDPLTPGATVKAKVGGKTITLKKGRDYSIAYKNNHQVGKATVIVKGKGNYTGTIRKTFKITPVKLYSVTLPYSAMVYTGKPITQNITVKAKTKTGAMADLTKALGSAYTITYKNNINVGTATVIVKGIGNFTGTIKKTFKIVK